MESIYDIRAIAPRVLNELRVKDDAGAPPRRVADTDGGSPLRCCMERSKPGETLAFVSYAPLRRWARETGADPGAYDEVGPVFVHPLDCGGRRGPTGSFPEAMRGERRTLRAYSARGCILGGLLLDGSQERTPTIEEGLAELYADPRVAAVHVRAVEFGCFLVETRRAVPPGGGWTAE
ncbi:DUF1203 domain-containing protein [Streptomyces sp. NBC_01775]|uniref:DUF1203 domain-containing protein n=1 Tax=Streptomyces sp. NBC_01775 TaxID=2975939 RepID=UPI002DDC325B|nr:DUF1203 domain-containing protein [Streptomyces sp. NBC_01775]WSB75439.1 DUF1203 domain-containing protein [Streptomyces sp. NBC_01775]